MTWNTINKPNLYEPSAKLLTPDGNNILVGKDEDLILILSPLIDKWNLVNKKVINWNTVVKPTI